MDKRKLGNQGLVVSKVGLGCGVMAGPYGPADDAESIAAIHRALELGIDFFDTADSYGPHTNEELLGRALNGRRHEAIIGTKFMPPTQTTGRREYVIASCDASLKRLGTDYIDLYYQHLVDRTAPIEDTFSAMAELVKQGKVRYLGICNTSAGVIQRAHAVHPLSAVQSEYSLFTRVLEDTVIPAMRNLGIGLVAYSPLGRGFLTGGLKNLTDLTPDDWRHNSPHFQADNFRHNVEVGERFKRVSAEKMVAPGQLALAWVLAKGQDIVPIPGTRRRNHLEQNVAAANISISGEEVACIEQVVPISAVAGTAFADMSIYRE
jgi:aryl-alcohol dehydrogenase-like predicted oxidoreductase